MKEKKVLIVNEQSNSSIFAWLYDFFRHRSWEILCNDSLKAMQSYSEDKPDIIFFLIQEFAFKNYLLPDFLIDQKHTSVVVLLFNDTGNLAKLLVNNELSGYLFKEKQAAETGKTFPHEDDLAKAIENKELILNYQPIVSLNSGKIAGFESLIRWNHPKKGIVSPEKFIPLAEATGLILPIGCWTIEEAVGQLEKWQEKYKYNPELTVSINLSTVQFINPNLVENVKRTINKYSINPESVRFEITENAFMKDMEASNLMLLSLKAMNVLLYMDDFGTGYSSLTYLQHFPVDALKIDKSFVKWMGIDEGSSEIVSSVISLAHNLKMFVIAEGVETEEHLKTLRNLNCEYAQGYYFSRPVAVDDAEKLLSSIPGW